MEHLLNFDLNLLIWLNKSLGSQWLDPLVLLLTAEKTWIAFSLFSLGFFTWKRNKKMLAMIFYMLLALSLTDALSYWVLKPYFNRIRPCHTVENLRLLKGTCAGIHSFPSNHAGNAAAVTTIAFSYLSRPLASFVLLTALLVSLTRVYMAVHYPSDIFFGFLLGLLLGFLVLKSKDKIGKIWLKK